MLLPSVIPGAAKGRSSLMDYSRGLKAASIVSYAVVLKRPRRAGCRLTGHALYGPECRANRSARREVEWSSDPRMATLHHHPICPQSRFIRLVLGEIGLEVELKEERVWERRREFLMLNPAGTTPATRCRPSW
jgi:hypothetical protein